MTRSEFITKIENGYDNMFDVAGKHYTILTWTDAGIEIGEQNRPDVPIQCFATAEQLVDNFLVHDVPLSKLVQKVVITDYS